MVLRWCKRWDVRLEAAGHQLVRLDGWIIFMQHHRTLEVFTMYFAGSYCATVILRITSKIGISYLTHNCQQIFSIVITIWIYFIICSLQLCTMPFKKTRQLHKNRRPASINNYTRKLDIWNIWYRLDQSELKQHYQHFLFYVYKVGINEEKGILPANTSYYQHYEHGLPKFGNSIEITNLISVIIY